ncbi:MAG TPA: serine hydrolase [Pilimelia sp.]|nr:serine hydrolase [Pilimelia sp.]
MPLSLVGAIVLVAVAFVTVAGLRFVPGSPLTNAASEGFSPQTPGASSPAATPTPEATTPPPLAIQPTTVRLNRAGWWAWAMLDTRTGEIHGSRNLAGTSTTASLIKAWIAADFLRRSAQAGEDPSQLRMDQLTIMIRDSDNNAAQALWDVVGRQRSTDRMVKLCGLTDSTPHPNWSNTKLSPRDVARLGACIADGRAAGAKWTKWLLKEMRLVRGVGDFGIRKAFPPAEAKTIAIKNGWVVRDAEGNYHVNCLAIGDGWTMGVMTRYPANLDYTYGAETCEEIARQLRR